jgi:hypothetical protein
MYRKSSAELDPSVANLTSITPRLHPLQPRLPPSHLPMAFLHKPDGQRSPHPHLDANKSQSRRPHSPPHATKIPQNDLPHQKTPVTSIYIISASNPRNSHPVPQPASASKSSSKSRRSRGSQPASNDHDSIQAEADALFPVRALAWGVTVDAQER